MNKIVLILTLCMSTFFYAQQNSGAQLNWETNFDVAKVKAQKSNKPILMLFTGSDWCPPCKALKKDVLNSSMFKEKSKVFVLLLVDFPKNKERISSQQANANKELNMAYGVRSFPTLIAVDYKGNVIDKIKNYNSNDGANKYFAFIDQIRH